MHSEYERYAIHWVPQHGTALARFGSGWTGWCADSGGVDSDPDIRQLAQRQRRVLGPLALHGIHANLAAPFVLARGASLWRVHHKLEDLAYRTPPIDLPAMEVTVHDGHVALALTGPSPEVHSLRSRIAGVIRAFADKTPCTGGTQTRRTSPTGRQSRASASHDPTAAFEVALTDRLDPAEAQQIVADIAPILQPILRQPQVLSDLALLGDPGEGRPWRLLERYALADLDPFAADQPGGMGIAGPDLLTGFESSLDHREQPLVA